MKLVSVIIPVYNVEQYITATLESVFAQTYQNFEIIIVDDESPDRSIEICQKFSDNRIKIIRQKNRGLPGARNTGIRHAKGDYIAFLDSDDLWLPQKLEKHVDHLNHSSEVGISFSYSAFIDEQGNSTGLYQIPTKIKGITSAYVLCRNPIGNGSAAVIRKEVFEDIRFSDNLYGVLEDCYFDERLRQAKADATDIECWLRMSLQTQWESEGIPEALTLYRVNSSGLSANALNQLTALEAVIEKTRSYAPEFIAKHENTAKAYYLRYISRRLVSLGDGKKAVKVANEAIATSSKILLEEPRRTILTVLAAYFLWLLPLSLYQQLEEIGIKLTGKSQKRRLLQNQQS